MQDKQDVSGKLQTGASLSSAFARCSQTSGSKLKQPRVVRTTTLEPFATHSHLTVWSEHAGYRIHKHSSLPPKTRPSSVHHQNHGRHRTATLYNRCGGDHNFHCPVPCRLLYPSLYATTPSYYSYLCRLSLHKGVQQGMQALFPHRGKQRSLPAHITLADLCRNITEVKLRRGAWGLEEGPEAAQRCRHEEDQLRRR